MAVLGQWYCRECDSPNVQAWSDDVPECCGETMRVAITRVNSPEWGSPRSYPHLRDEPFESRSELNRFARDNNLALGARSEKVGGARNESHLNIGKKYSYAGSPKS